MFSLRKIKELKGYRFFQDYKWDENTCKLFEKYNLIYGWNGSGKTTLCDFFKNLEDGTISSDEATCILMFEDSTSGQMKSITQANLGSLPYAFKVFHQNYIQENISKDNVKHIFTVGKEQADKLAEAKRLRAVAVQQSATVKKSSGEYAGLLQEIDRFKTAKAKSIKDAANYTNAFNKNRYYEAHRALTTKKILSKEEYQKAMAAIRAQPRSELPISKQTFIQSTVREYICGILEQTPVNNTIQALKEDVAVSNWVEHGLGLHEEKNSAVCLFCGNVISNNRFDELRSHFNKSYKELSERIEKAITLLYSKHEQFESAKRGLPHSGLLYPEFQQQYQEYVVTAVKLCDQYMTVILDIIDVLKRKKSDMINEELTAEFITLVDQLPFDYSVFENINGMLNAHNKKTKEFQQSIQRAQKSVELHLVSIYAEEFAAFEKKAEDKRKEVDIQKKILEDQEKQISLLEQDVRNSQIPADEINNDIAFITGRSELVFTNTDLGYRITRNGKRAKHLSKGEENAIALIYFFNALKDVDVNAQNTIVVLDDIGIVWYKGMCYCKKLVPKNDGLLLVSLNKGYSPIPVESFDEYHLFGEVVDIISAE